MEVGVLVGVSELVGVGVHPPLVQLTVAVGVLVGVSELVGVGVHPPMVQLTVAVGVLVGVLVLVTDIVGVKDLVGVGVHPPLVQLTVGVGDLVGVKDLVGVGVHPPTVQLIVGVGVITRVTSGTLVGVMETVGVKERVKEMVGVLVTNTVGDTLGMVGMAKVNDFIPIFSQVQIIYPLSPKPTGVGCANNLNVGLDNEEVYKTVKSLHLLILASSVLAQIVCIKPLGLAILRGGLIHCL